MNILVVQRCDVFGVWPENASLETRPFTVSFGDPIKFVIARFCIKTYSNRSNFSNARTQASSSFVDALPHMDRSLGFYVGDMLYVAEIGDAVGRLEMKAPLEGQVDFILKLEYGIDHLEAAKFMSPYIANLVLIVGKYTGDLISPVRGAYIYRAIENSKDFTIPINSGGTMVRKNVEQQALLKSLVDLQAFSKDRPNEGVIKSGLASRRIMNARGELDIIDKFSDYWEACEHLCSGPLYQQYKDKSMKVSVGLSKIYGFSAHDIWEFLAKPIYEIRNEVVHEYAIDETRVRYPLRMLDDMASNILLAFIGSTPVLPDSVSAYFDDVRSRKLTPMPRLGRPSSCFLR